MSWAVGFDPDWHRDIGYGVPAICDRPVCEEKIDRGLGHVCGGDPYGGERGCGLYFCGHHLTGTRKVGDRLVWVCGRCDKNRPPYKPTPDTAEWLRWKLADESWAEWRCQNPGQVEHIKAVLASEAEVAR